MDASPTTIQSAARTTGSRRWRSLLAGLISLALVMSIFHGWTFDGDDDATPAASIALTVNDTEGKAPAHPAPLHGDHCLTHVASVAPQETAFPIAYAPHRYGDTRTQPPAAADSASPFKPPRA